MGLLSRAKEALKKHVGGKRRRKKKQHVPRVTEDSAGRALARSVGGFLLGMMVAGLYGALVLFVQGYNIWYCLVTTISLAAGLGLGMAFSCKVRLTVLLVLPQIFSREGKNILLLLAVGLAMQGPFANIMRNFTRSAECVSCGAELILNQTAEMLQRAKQPLIKLEIECWETTVKAPARGELKGRASMYELQSGNSKVKDEALIAEEQRSPTSRDALQKIKDIAKKVKVVGDRVRKLFGAVIDAVRHVAHCLRNVWYWLLHLGEICNQEIGTPFRKCVRIFDNAKDECERVIPFLYFLCHIVLLFKPLCGLANVLLLFCIIPNYIVPFLRRNVVAPIASVIDRVRKEFEFNITTVHHYDVRLNASKSLSQVAFDIMEEVDQRLQPAREAVGLFGYMSTLVILYIYIKALLYRKRYLREDSFDNIYITQEFRAMDSMRAKLKKATVLPLSAKESVKYIRPASLVLPRRERLRYALALASICRHLILVTLLIVADYSVFWLLDLVRYQLHGEIAARAPVTMSISVNGTGYSGEIYRDMVSAFDVLQRGNISVLSRKCRLRPAEPDYNGYIVIGLMYGTCFFIAVFGSYIQRLRRVVCAWYYPSREKERICYLYNTILTRRTGLVRAVLKSVRERSADGGHTNILLILAARAPFFAWLATKLGVQQAYCMGCGKIREGPSSESFITCITPGCRGIYCPECYQLLNNICSICMAPLTYQGEMDEEIDSSDEETVTLWIRAVQVLRKMPEEGRQEQRQLLRHRILQAMKGRGHSRRLPADLAKKMLAQLEEEESNSEDTTSSSSSEASGPGSSSSLDFSYQDEVEASDGEGPPQELTEVKADETPHSEK